jgi:putative ABC transport system permease protein
MATLWQDLRYALRTMRRAPGFTVMAAGVLALGIGTTSAMFALVDAALIRALPFSDPARLVMIWERTPGGTRNRVSPLNFLDWSEQNRAFTAVAAVSGGSSTMTGADGSAERIPGQSVTARFFDVLGVSPIAGRTFVDDDARAKRDVVVLSERLWRSRFGADPGIVGRTIRLNDQPQTVIGIVPARFEIMFPSDLWTLFVPKRSPEQRRMHYMQVVGRLRDDATLDTARHDMARVGGQIAQIAPETNKGWGVTVDPLRAALVSDDLRTTSLVLSGVVGFVLLMACANVANLLVGRGMGRAQELAVRAAIGGSRRRLRRQLITESAVLASLGGAVGLAAAWTALRLTPAFLPPATLPTGISLRFDARLTAFTLVVTGLTVLLAGMAPAWHSARVTLTDVLKAASRTTTASGRWMRAGLAASQIAAAVLLVCGAGLLLRTLERMTRVEAAYARRDVLTMQVSLPLTRYPTPRETRAFYEAVEREVESVPGVRLASFGDNLPLDGWNIGQGFEVVGDPPVDPAARTGARYQIVGTRYFDVLGIALARGRAFGRQDSAASTPVCIVSQSFVDRYARGRDPLTLRVNVQAMGMSGPEPVVRAIVGVAPDVPESAGQTDTKIAIYVPIAQNPWYSASLAVRTAGAPEAVLPGIKAAVGRVDKGLPLTRVRTMEEVAAESVAVPRFRAVLVGAFAVLALTLAGIGIFGVLALAVHQRTREFGIRLALGARQADLLRLVMGEGVRVTLSGLAAGLAGAALLTRSLSTLLYGVAPLDPVTFIAAPAVLGVTALTACAVPAMRAARTDSARALRT